MENSRRDTKPARMGSLPPRYSFVLNPYARERFTKCPTCEAPTRIRKLPLVVHLEYPDAPRLVLLNKSCRLCLLCETLIVHRAELDRVIAAAGLCGVETPEYVVLGTIDRGTWRRGVAGDAHLADVRASMADFKKHLKIDVIPAHWAPRNQNAD